MLTKDGSKASKSCHSSLTPRNITFTASCPLTGLRTVLSRSPGRQLRPAHTSAKAAGPAGSQAKLAAPWDQSPFFLLPESCFLCCHHFVVDLAVLGLILELYFILNDSFPTLLDPQPCPIPPTPPGAFLAAPSSAFTATPAHPPLAHQTAQNTVCSGRNEAARASRSLIPLLLSQFTPEGAEGPQPLGQRPLLPGAASPLQGKSVILCLADTDQFSAAPALFPAPTTPAAGGRMGRESRDAPAGAGDGASQRSLCGPSPSQGDFQGSPWQLLHQPDPLQGSCQEPN